MKILRITAYSLFVSALLIGGFFAMPVSAQAENSVEDTRKLALAQKFFEIRPVSLVAIKAIETLAAARPADQQALFMQQMRLHMDFAQLEAEMTEALVKTYTTAEIEKMVEYYGSDIGRSITEKQSVFEQDVTGILQKMIDKAFVQSRYGTNGLQSRP